MPLFPACSKHSQYAMFYRSRSIILQVSMLTRPSQQTVRAFQRRTARAAMSLSQKWIIMDNFNGGFLKWGYPNSWMVYKGRSQNKIDDVVVLAFEETSRSWNTRYRVRLDLLPWVHFVPSDISPSWLPGLKTQQPANLEFGGFINTISAISYPQVLIPSGDPKLTLEDFTSEVRAVRAVRAAGQ